MESISDYSVLKLFSISESGKDFVQNTYFGASHLPRNSILLTLGTAKECTIFKPFFT